MQCCYVKNMQDFKIIKDTQCHSYKLSAHISWVKSSICHKSSIYQHLVALVCVTPHSHTINAIIALHTLGQFSITTIGRYQHVCIDTRSGYL